MRRLHLMLGLLLVSLTGACLEAAAPAAAPSEPVVLKIKPASTITGENVTLADVLIFPPNPAVLPDNLPQSTLAGGVMPPATLVVTYEQILRRLNELGVNTGQVLLGGASKCIVTINAAASDPAGSQPPLAASHASKLEGEQSLAQILRDQINSELAELGGTAEVEFERAGEPFLALTRPTWEFSIRSSGRSRLGPREFQVVLRRDGKTQRTATIMARVHLSKEVLVARSPLNVGTLVQRDAVVLEPRLFEREQDIGLSRIEQALGQRVARFVGPGQMVTSADLKSEDLVQRSRPVTILGGNGNLNVRMTGVALDSGIYGEQVRVRIGDARQSRNVLRGTVTGLATVRVAEGPP